MARYIRAVECAEKISEIFHIPLGDLVDVFAEIPSADVAPRSEIEREIGEEIYRIIGDGDNETWICLLIRKLADNLTGKGEALNAETCVVCGDVIPEGRQVCPTCERQTNKK